MYMIGQILRELRENKALQISEVEEASGIGGSHISRIENGRRLPTVSQIQKLASIYDISSETLLAQRESDRIIHSLEYPDVAMEALNIAEQKLSYGIGYLETLNNSIYTKPLPLESRRYIGSKAKLTDWIMTTIRRETTTEGTFCDLFAGTGVVASRALEIYDRVIINDFLYSNNVIYRAFFEEGDWRQKRVCDLLDYYNTIDPDSLRDNYFSTHFGGKYYEQSVAKKIGYIRQCIEEIRHELTPKEYNILLATLIYNIDRLANTVGHFDAYIKKPITPRPLRLRPIDAMSYEGAEIHRDDSNLLAREISADVVYIDPPYNSRQYCRFYHLYETLVKWDAPELFGVALKPAPENMSAYCTVRAVDAFRDLVSVLDTKYIVVSYNNTYKSKSNSSENKMRLEDIKEILELCGETKVFSQSHQYFNAGKTDFSDHKELLFVTKVDYERRDKAFPTLLRW